MRLKFFIVVFLFFCNFCFAEEKTNLRPGEAVINVQESSRLAFDPANPPNQSVSVAAFQGLKPGSKAAQVYLPSAAITAFPQSLKVYQNQSINIWLSGGAIEGDGALSYAVIAPPQNGILKTENIGRGQVVYTPNENFVGTDKFTFAIQMNDFVSPPAPVTIQVEKNIVTSSPASDLVEIHLGGNVTADPFLIEINKKQTEFFREQREERVKFMTELQEQNLEGEELERKLNEFRRKELENEQKFLLKRQRAIEKHSEELAVGNKFSLDSLMSRVTGFFKSDDTFLEQLDKKRQEFTEKQKQRRREFFGNLQNQNLTPDEMQDRVDEFTRDEIKREQKFQEKRQKAIEDHVAAIEAGQSFSLDEIVAQLAGIFNELI